MKFCSHCGAQIDDNAVVCVKCGCSVAQKDTNPQDAPSIGFAILAFFFPLIGFILYLVWKDSLPRRAGSVGKGALAGFLFDVLLPIACCLSCAGIVGCASCASIAPIA